VNAIVPITNPSMSPEYVPQDVDQEHVAAIKRQVSLCALIEDRYPALEPALDSRQRGRASKCVSIPSPFRDQDDTSSISVVLPDDGVWSDPLRPPTIPGDVIGFVMAHDACDYERAVEILWQMLLRFRRYRELDGMHLRLVTDAHAETLLAEVRHTRERIEATGGYDLLIPRRRKDGCWR
jgi:hypothetical protein